MGIGDFASTGQSGRFSMEELIFLNQLSEAGFQGVVDELYPGFDQFFASREAGLEETSSESERNIASGSSGGAGLSQFVSGLGQGASGAATPAPTFSGRPPSAPGTDFLSRVLDIPPALTSGLRPAGDENFPFSRQFGDGELLGLEGIADAQQKRGHGGLGEMIKGETSLKDFGLLLARNAVKGAGHMAISSAANALAPGAGIVGSFLAPGIFGRPGGVVREGLSFIGDKITDFVFGNEPDEQEPGDDAGGFEIAQKGRDAVQEGFAAVRDATGITYLDNVISGAIDNAREAGGEAVGTVQQLISDVLGLDRQEVTTEEERETAGEIGVGARSFQEDFGSANLMQNIAVLSALAADVRNFGDISQGANEAPLPGGDLFVGPVSLEEQVEADANFEENFNSVIRAASEGFELDTTAAGFDIFEMLRHLQTNKGQGGPGFGGMTVHDFVNSLPVRP